ncbi:MAG: DUF2505 domain-containing protein [Myxococcales bacterium]|nr:DUF2505 domain-containing protein [Myxococcota bacterium]MDW8280634.1 DUF2505 domain-containing protein [Myxococcales bacterium]
MQFCFSHDFDIDPAGFWEIFFNEEYNQELYRQLNIRSRTVVEQQDDGVCIRRIQRVEPSVPIPAWAASVIKSTAYTEHNLFYRDRSVMDVRIEPAVMAERFHLSGVFAVTPLPEGRCRREFRGELRIAVPLLGPRIEKLMVEQIREAYETAARLTHQWVKRHKARPSS